MSDPEVGRRLLAAALEATRHLDREGCLEALARGGRDLCGAAFALAYLADSTGEDLECWAAAGAGDIAPLRGALGVIDAGLVRHLAPDGPAVIPDADVLLPTGDPAALPGLGPALLAPLSSSSGPVGLLLLIRSAGGAFDADDVACAAGLAREAVAALDNLRAVESLRELVIRDDTADCYNRRYLDQSLEDEVERARRFGGRFAVVFLDMDNLKEVNTQHGHAAGSRVLYEASLRICRSVRSIDRLFRYGGDEFVVLLPGTTLAGAREAAERIRRALEAQPFEMSSGAQVQLTGSAGVAAWPEHGPSGRAVVEAGDQAMRAVKELGKNRVGCAPV
ncbi:MAG: GGDEF domain-containing protein [Acidobacteria bacterium]|nr:GGDEF domain-containing protein [Acidobacteriota bacterium]